MSPEQFIKSLQTNKPISTDSIKKSAYEFELLHIDLAPTSGFPTVHFSCEKENVIIRMSINPVLGLDSVCTNGLSYVFALVVASPLDNRIVALITSSLLDTFACSHIVPQSTPESVAADAESTEGDRFIFRLAIEKTPDIMEGVYVHSVIATVEVDDNCYERAKAVVLKQAEKLFIQKGM